MRRLIINNQSSAELGIMLEPWCDREDVEAGGRVTIEGDFADDELMIDFGAENFVSVWTPPGCKLRKG